MHIQTLLTNYGNSRPVQCQLNLETLHAIECCSIAKQPTLVTCSVHMPSSNHVSSYVSRNVYLVIQQKWQRTVSDIIVK